MGLIGQWIDQTTAAHPALMRKVLDRPFGTLAKWVDVDEEGDVCGCLIGSTALAAGVVDGGEPGCGEDAPLLLGRMLGPISAASAFDVGVYAAGLARHMSGVPYWRLGKATTEGDLRAIALIKARIARALARHDAPTESRELVEAAT